MAFRPIGNPIPENAYENFWHAQRRNGRPRRRHGEPWNGFGPARSAPAELPYVDLDPNSRRWHRGGRALPRKFTPNKFWARPVDGKHRGAMGRLKDGLTCEGADVYVVINGDPRTAHRDRPHRAQWSGWDGPRFDRNNWRDWWTGGDMDHTYSQDVHRNMPWAADHGKRYNYRSRRYEGSHRLLRNEMEDKLWTDVYWPEGAKRRDRVPLTYRDGLGMYETRVPRWTEYYAGGRPGFWP